MDQSVSIIRSDRQQHNRNKNEKKNVLYFHIDLLKMRHIIHQVIRFAGDSY